jgi:hypothetical protein
MPVEHGSAAALGLLRTNSTDQGFLPRQVEWLSRIRWVKWVGMKGGETSAAEAVSARTPSLWVTFEAEFSTGEFASLSKNGKAKSEPRNAAMARRFGVVANPV